MPFADGAFDYAAAVTSLCFVPEPAGALAEMWRVSRRGLVRGLLNRHSLLHRRKAGRNGYRGARWDTLEEVRRWTRPLKGVHRVRWASGVFLPGGGALARRSSRLFRNACFGGISGRRFEQGLTGRLRGPAGANSTDVMLFFYAE